jgi:transposase InsO family protein
MERQLDLPIKKLRTDNGGEYVNSVVEVLLQFLGSMGIKHQHTVPYSPQQNGKAERLNRTLLEKTRCMLADSKLPASLWGEAVTTACLLRIVSPVG